MVEVEESIRTVDGLVGRGQETSEMRARPSAKVCKGLQRFSREGKSFLQQFMIFTLHPQPSANKYIGVPLMVQLQRASSEWPPANASTTFCL